MGEDTVDPDNAQLMGSEDFAFMLEQRPGNIALLGNGSTTLPMTSTMQQSPMGLPTGRD
ncbi:hypothetical protein [Agrobacterium rubi]|uniref:hypothetical protein n=1 Tax=Agrobacterium rubi TaxID=28099 RepID=UPI00157481CE|nr:hypothetical protein [Agrobacterium rubi]